MMMMTMAAAMAGVTKAAATLMPRRRHAASAAICAAAVVAACLVALPYASLAPAYSQGEVSLATFHEGATVLVDRTGSYNVSTSVTLQSTSILEMRVPQLLEKQLRDDALVTAVVVTNQGRCVLGVNDDESCILVNMERDPEAAGIVSLQDSSRARADAYIGAINEALDTDASYHSVFVHSGSDRSGASVGLPGIASGRATVSVVYVMPMADTDWMYQKMSAILLPESIRESGGFYDAARTLAAQSNAKMLFAIIPSDSGSLLQLKVVSVRPINASAADVVRPLEMMGLEALERSEYFSSGFYPLNSVVQVAISSADAEASVYGSAQAELPTRVVDGEKIPTDVAGDGWIFDPDRGKLIHAKYIFGQQRTALEPGDLEIVLAGGGNGGDTAGGIGGVDIAGTQTDEQLMIVIAVAAIAAAAAIFYLRGYGGAGRRQPVS